MGTATRATWATRWLGFAVALGALVPLAACGDDEDSVTPAERDASIYATVLREMVLTQMPPSDTTGDDGSASLPILYVTGADGESIAVDVQAEVVKNLKDEAEVRFVDAREDALVTDGDGDEDGEAPATSIPGDEPVQNSGVLTIFGPLPPDGTTVQLDVEIYLSSLLDESFVVTLAGSQAKWVIRATEPVG